jgi:2,5-furandicarboxylate decarboxylase 1
MLGGIKMADLQSFLRALEEKYPDDIAYVDTPIDPLFEPSALVAKLGALKKRPVIIFKNIKGSAYPVVTNVTASRKRLALALGVTPDKLVERYVDAIRHPLPPVTVDSGPVFEEVTTGKDVNILKFPQITHHQADAGPYFTGAIILCKDPESGKYNASFNRLMIKDKSHTAIHLTTNKHLWHSFLKKEREGKPLEIAILIGVHPALALGSLYIGGMDDDELGIMGALTGEPLQVAQCKTIDLKVPVHTEILLEAEILPNVREAEGPFGEFTGYSIGQRQREVVKIKAICQRKSPLFYDISVGQLDHLLLSTLPMEASLYTHLKAAVPAVQAVRIPAPFTAFISIRNTAPGIVNNAILAGINADMYMKCVVVVDEDINIFDTARVLWAIGTRCQPQRDIMLLPNLRGSDLDPSCVPDGFTSKMGIDATAKPSLREFPSLSSFSQEVMDRLNLDELVRGQS